ncbi:lung seven transmembrane receptor [Anaeramoeba flamelloides]|uniref:Lung seven transmembrane receptor n=1 Tax=Anaeramoeba flamelloides TaxID=1746091 RepID=A0ABQ8ZCZ9_9EUKA|nr:lung seven transmembrane receptor [Anaeramoeba flamelloides]
MNHRFTLSLFLLVFLISPTFALIDDYSLKTSNQFFRLTTFGFQKGGTIDFEATTDSNGQNIWFMACNEKEYTTLSEKKQEEACENMGSETFICESTSNLEISPFQFNKTVQEEGYRYFVFLNCEKDLQTITYQLKYTFMNPNGQYLSLGYIPLPGIYLVFAIVWVLMVIYWFINWFRHFNIKIKLHKFLTFIVYAFKMFFEKSPWFPILSQIFVDFFLFVGIGLTFRLREFNQLFHEPPRMTGNFHEPTEGYEAVDSEIDDNLQEWIQGMPLPRWDNDEELNEENVVMIENIGEEKKIDLGQQETQEKEEINK